MPTKRQPKGTPSSKGGQFAAGVRADDTSVGAGTLVLERPTDAKPTTQAEPREPDSRLNSVRLGYVAPTRSRKLSSEYGWYRIGDAIAKNADRQTQLNEYILGHLTEECLQNPKWLERATADAADLEAVAENVDAAFDAEVASVLDTLSRDHKTRVLIAETTRKRWTCGQQARFYQITAESYKVAAKNRSLRHRIYCRGCGTSLDKDDCLQRGGFCHCNQRCLSASKEIEQEVRKETRALRANPDTPFHTIFTPIKDTSHAAKRLRLHMA